MAKKKNRLEGELGAFVQQYARKSDPHSDPNDRRYDRTIEERVKRMDPEELSQLLHGSDDEDLEKDPQLFDIVERLRQRLGSTAFIVVDHWEADPTAIGVASPTNPRVLAYLALSTSPGRYHVHLELPADVGSQTPYVNAGQFEGDLEDVVTIVGQHLRGSRL